MDAISCRAARANLAKTMDRVCKNHEPLIITRGGEPAVVIISLEDYKAMEETAEGAEGIVVRRAGRYTSEEMHRALFEEAPEPKTLEELKTGARKP